MQHATAMQNKPARGPSGTFHAGDRVTAVDVDAEFVRNDEAAKYIRRKYGFLTPASLRKATHYGYGPPHSRMGRLILFRITDLDAWAQSRIAPVQSRTTASS